MKPIYTTTLTPINQYLLQLGDNALILSHRLSEWCGHGPVLEQDIALTNISLDILGQARLWYQLAAELSEGKYSEDDLAYFRDTPEFRNCLLAEQPNVDWAHTLVRQFIYDSFQLYFLEALKESVHPEVKAIAAKSLIETQYHARWSSEWLIRLGDGTDESHQRMQAAVDGLWPYHQELILSTALEKEMARLAIGVDLDLIKAPYLERLETTIHSATLRLPDSPTLIKGGKTGIHSEHLGYILATMQHLQRSLPGLEW